MDHRLGRNGKRCPSRHSMDQAAMRSKAGRRHRPPCIGRQTCFGRLSNFTGAIRRSCQLPLQHRSHRPCNFDETALSWRIRSCRRRIRQMAVRRRAGTRRAGPTEARRSRVVPFRQVADVNLAARLTGTESHSIPLLGSKEYNKCVFSWQVRQPSR